MRVLALDPGAKRAGWAVIETGPIYISSSCEWLERNLNPEEPFQKYRMRLCKHWTDRTEWLISTFKPDLVVTETVPSQGANNMSQMYLANVMATTVHSVCFKMGIPVIQVSARTVASRVAIRGKGKKISKANTRNGVLSLLPELKPRLSEWVKVFEEPDALAIGLHALGHIQ